MIEIQYGSQNYCSRAWKEIDEGHPVTIIIMGWRRRLIRHMVLLFIEYDQLSRKGKVSRGLYFRLGWKTLLSLPIMGGIIGLCHQARSVGLAVAADENGKTLEIKFG